MSLSLHLPRLTHGRHHPAEIQRRLTADRDLALAAIQDLRAKLADANKQRDAANARSSRLAETEAEVQRLRTENTALRAQLANAHRINVPPGHRDIDADDTATQPIPTGDMWADPTRWNAAARGSRVIHLADAVDADTQEIPRPHAA